jgi:hypothetical protein
MRFCMCKTINGVQGKLASLGKAYFYKEWSIPHLFTEEHLEKIN